MPSPRPVSPSPSVEVALTDTGAPTAADSAASASARRGPIRGALPITWIATLPTVQPASRSRRTTSPSSVDPARAGPLRIGRAEHRAEIAEPGRRQQRVAGGVRGDIAVGVPRAAVDAGPEQPGQPARAAGLDRVHVDADADPASSSSRLPPSSAMRLGDQQVPRPGDLERLVGARRPRRPAAAAPRSGRRRRSPRASPRVRRDQRGPAKSLRGLDRAQLAAVDGRDHDLVGVDVDPLDRVDHRHRRARPRRPRRPARRPPGRSPRPGRTAGDIVHEHRVDISRRSAASPTRTESSRVTPPAITSAPGRQRRAPDRAASRARSR